MDRKKEPQGVPAHVADCPVCDGTGIQPLDFDLDPPDKDNECPRCKGRGGVSSTRPDEEDDELDEVPR